MYVIYKDFVMYCLDNIDLIRGTKLSEDFFCRKSEKKKINKNETKY